MRKLLSRIIKKTEQQSQPAWRRQDLPIRVFNLGSGSKGNASLVCYAGKILMVDCGFSCKQIILRMNSLGLDPSTVCGILVSHEHGDHVKGAQKCSRDLGAPILATQGTLSGSGLPSSSVRALAYDEPIEHEGFVVTPVPISHDTPEPCAYLVEVAGVRSLFATDIGNPASLDITPLGQIDVLYVEANYDEEMLRDGPYPAFLKHRIMGDGGHLNNQQSGNLIKSLAAQSPGLRTIMLAHLSEKNNHPVKALNTAKKYAGILSKVSWQVASQNCPMELDGGGAGKVLA
jgi:phosphoribosyl 1,2-cyclic phosphodiesterase